MQVGAVQPISFSPPASLTIADRLADLIANGALRPGQRLVQTELASLFGVSRLPVRDALRKLEQRGLVVTRPRGGVVVRPIKREELRQTYAMRRLLEPVAVEEAMARLSQQDMQHLEEILAQHVAAAEEGDMAAVMKWDQEFHDFLFSRTQNQLLVEMARSLWPRIHQARSVVLASQGGHQVGKNSVPRHRQLLDALWRRDSEAVKSEVVEVISAAEREIVTELERLGWVE